MKMLRARSAAVRTPSTLTSPVKRLRALQAAISRAPGLRRCLSTDIRNRHRPRPDVGSPRHCACACAGAPHAAAPRARSKPGAVSLVCRAERRGHSVGFWPDMLTARRLARVYKNRVPCVPYHTGGRPVVMPPPKRRGSTHRRGAEAPWGRTLFTDSWLLAHKKQKMPRPV